MFGPKWRLSKHSRRHLETILGVPGAIWGPSWASLGPFWGHLEASPGQSGAILKPIWASKGQGRKGKTKKQRKRANSAKRAQRLDESTIFDVPGIPVEAFSRQLWGILGSSWTLGAILGPSSGLLGRSWGHLGASWGQLGGCVVPKWRSHRILRWFC